VEPSRTLSIRYSACSSFTPMVIAARIYEID
jgi:hypothetical protein